MKVLACVDGSVSSKKVISNAQRLLRDKDDKLFLLTVTLPSAVSFDSTPGASLAHAREQDAVDKIAEERAKEVLEKYAEKISPDDAPKAAKDPRRKILRSSSLKTLMDVLEGDEMLTTLRHEYELLPKVGDPQEVIVQMCKDHGIDVVVLGHRSKSMLERWFAGSVAKYVVDYAPCHVFVSKAE